MRKIIHWFRNDLRLHDNEALCDAILLGDEVIPVYVFDERIFQSKTKFGFPKTNIHRCRFIIECIQELQENLGEIGLDLIIRIGKAEDILFDIANEHKTSWIFCNRERTDEEVKVQDALEEKLWTIGQEIRYYRGKMLYHTSDLPYPITHCPDVFSTFRKETEKFVVIRKPLDQPSLLKGHRPIKVFGDQVPTLEDFGWKSTQTTIPKYLRGGERKALENLRYYLWDTDLISNYFKTRNGLLGRDFSSKFSSYLSQGCISPKKIYAEVKRYEQERGENKSTYWIVFELLWRDFFRFMAKKHENKIFQLGGTSQKENVSNLYDEALFLSWANGETGTPFIDANMIELNKTGFMSNRGRQNVASFLVNDLKLDWRLGAEYFESLLIDFDPCSNYGNWNYIAGVGSDPRENRYFNIKIQANKYDPEGSFVKHWIPALKKVPKKCIHTLDQLSIEELKMYNIELGVNYPSSLISSTKWN